ncbi:MAG: FtsX-like permease family protein [Gammaproteobacteria bacterium]|nr:FtsX-like permease family protein [Gammaproteobacteria bacterium]
MKKNNSNIWRFSWQMLGRDWRGGELKILAIALVIAVTSVSSVGFFIDRVDRGMQQQAAELIAADLVISSPRRISPELEQAAKQRGLQTTRVISFRSVSFSNDRPQLVEVKAVTQGYPFRGSIRIADAAFSEDRTTDALPAIGEAWVEPRLLQLLKIKVGDVINIGALKLVIKQVLTYEPDRGGDMFSIAPRVMINQQDLAASQLLSIGALVNYRLLMAGDEKTVDDYRATLKKQLDKGEQLLTIKEGRPELRTALERAQRFLGLAALTSVLLAGVAVATAARRFATRHLDTSAILRCLGATQQTIIRSFTLEMLWLALIASTVGVVLGAITQTGITAILSNLLLANLPMPSAQPLILAYATGVILLLGFAIPPLLALKHVPPLRVLRRDQTGRGIVSWQVYLAVVVSMGILLQWQLADTKLVAYVMGGMLATVTVLALAAWGLVKLLNTLRQRVGVAWRFGLANIARRPAGSVIQITAFGLGIMVLLLLSTVRNDLLEGWRKSLPPDAPNHFLVNVQPDQVDAIQQFFKQQGVYKPQLFPMVRARLTHVNERLLNTSDYESERARRLLTREFNLSWAENIQIDNRIVAGRWWSKSEYGNSMMSLETGLAETLEIQLHDTIRFNINGQSKDFKVSSLRTVDWDTFNINFFSVVPPGVLEQEPASWVTSLYLDAAQKRQLSQLIQRYPNVTVIDIDAIITRVRSIIDRVNLAVEFIFLFTVMAGLAVLYAAIQASQDERRFESAVLRTVGASKAVLLRGLIAEFVTLGALAGVLAGFAATLLAWVLAVQVFNFPYQLNPAIGAVGIVVGVVIVGIAGVLGTRTVLTQPPVQTLRQGG